MIDRKAFDQFAPEYDKWFEDHDREYALELRAIREYLPGEGTGIEIGAGTGRFTLPLNIALGVEPSAAMRRIAVGRGANVVDGTAEAIPVGSGSQDFALLVTTVCFLEAPAIAFREAYRVLKERGLDHRGPDRQGQHAWSKIRGTEKPEHFLSRRDFSLGVGK